MDFFIIFLIGLGTSFFGSFMSGGLALLGITGLLATGMSPLIALGVYRVGTFGFSMGSLYKYVQAKKVIWSLIPAMTVAGIIGSVIGAQIIISTDEGLLEKIIGVVILFFIPVAMLRPKLGIIDTVVTAQSRFFGHISYFLASIWSASVAIGTGLIVMYPMMHFYGMTLLQVKGTNRIPSLIKNIVVIAIFHYYELITWDVGLVFALGMLIGGWFGAQYAIKIGDIWLRYILLATIGLFSVKLILGF